VHFSKNLNQNMPKMRYFLEKVVKIALNAGGFTHRPLSAGGSMLPDLYFIVTFIHY